MENLVKQSDDALLKLNLQHFADDEGGDDGSSDDGDNKDDDVKDDSVPDLDEGADDGSSDKIEFTEEQKKEMNRIIQDRLARERKAQEKKAQEEKQKEQGEFRELYEDTQNKLRNKIVETEMIKMGYTESQVERLSTYVSGNDEQEIKESLTLFKEDVPPKKVERKEPSAGPGSGTTPPPKDGKDVGRDLYETIKKKKRK